MQHVLHYVTGTGAGMVSGGTLLAMADPASTPAASHFVLIAGLLTGAMQLLNTYLLKRKDKQTKTENGIS